jgi:lethal(2) giant larvae protein
LSFSVEEDEEDEWPPFRKVGHYDPYSDDPRLAVKKLSFCSSTGRLVIGGTAGQVVVCELAEHAKEKALTVLKSDLVTEKEGFAWKGHSSLTVRSNALKLEAGYQPSCVLQVSPPASINSLACSTEWGLVAAGTAHGLVILDCILNAAIIAKCTLNAQGASVATTRPSRSCSDTRFSPQTLPMPMTIPCPGASR